MLMEKKDPRVNSRGRVGGRRPSAVAGQDSARPQPLVVARVGWRRRGTVRWRGRPAVRAVRRFFSGDVGPPWPSSGQIRRPQRWICCPLARSAPAVVVPVGSGAGGGGRRMGKAACRLGTGCFCASS